MRYYSTDPGDGRGDVVRIHDDGSVEVYAPGSTVERRKARWRPQDTSFENYANDIRFDRDGDWITITAAADLKRILRAQDEYRSHRDQIRLEKANGAA